MIIQYTKSAVKQINSLDKYTKQRIKNGIEKLPFGDIKKLKGYKNTYRLRIGNYRIIYQLYNDDTIIIEAVLPRGNAYDNL
jgi:mRNA interferase RelE/StbE